MKHLSVEKDQALAELLAATAEEYRKCIDAASGRENDVRLEIVRKLKLISDAIKGLMRPKQMDIYEP